MTKHSYIKLSVSAQRGLSLPTGTVKKVAVVSVSDRAPQPSTEQTRGWFTNSSCWNRKYISSSHHKSKRHGQGYLQVLDCLNTQFHVMFKSMLLAAMQHLSVEDHISHLLCVYLHLDSLRGVWVWHHYQCGSRHPAKVKGLCLTVKHLTTGYSLATQNHLRRRVIMGVKF